LYKQQRHQNGSNRPINKIQTPPKPNNDEWLVTTTKPQTKQTTSNFQQTNNKPNQLHKTPCTNNTTKPQKDLPMVEALVHHAEQGNNPPVVWHINQCRFYQPNNTKQQHQSINAQVIPHHISPTQTFKPSIKAIKTPNTLHQPKNPHISRMKIHKALHNKSSM